MQDFYPWLYANYIKPHLKTCSKKGYEMPLSLMENDLTPPQLEDYAQAMEFVAIQAFRLGAWTGAGMEVTSPSKPLE